MVSIVQAKRLARKGVFRHFKKTQYYFQKSGAK
jgi:hypothetical protein